MQPKEVATQGWCDVFYGLMAVQVQSLQCIEHNLDVHSISNLIRRYPSAAIAQPDQSSVCSYGQLRLFWGL